MISLQKELISQLKKAGYSRVSFPTLNGSYFSKDDMLISLMDQSHGELDWVLDEMKGSPMMRDNSMAGYLGDQATPLKYFKIRPTQHDACIVDEIDTKGNANKVYEGRMKNAGAFLIDQCK